MRPAAPVALILTIGLVAAACGGDEATPEPADEATAAATATAASEEPAKEVTDVPATATEAPAEDATEAPAEPTAELEPAEPEFAKRAEQNSGGDPEVTFGLAGGMWRMLWESEGCERVEMAVSQVDGDFSGGKSSKSSTGTSIISGVPEGTFTLEQLDPACTEWTLKMTWMS